MQHSELEFFEHDYAVLDKLSELDVEIYHLINMKFLLWQPLWVISWEWCLKKEVFVLRHSDA